jgi:hypothetical protein
MRVSHETVYQALFVQGKGSLRAEVAQALRCGSRARWRHRMAHRPPAGAGSWTSDAAIGGIAAMDGGIMCG